MKTKYSSDSLPNLDPDYLLHNLDYRTFFKKYSNNNLSSPELKNSLYDEEYPAALAEYPISESLPSLHLKKFLNTVFCPKLNEGGSTSIPFTKIKPTSMISIDADEEIGQQSIQKVRSEIKLKGDVNPFHRQQNRRKMTRLKEISRERREKILQSVLVDSIENEVGDSNGDAVDSPTGREVMIPNQDLFKDPLLADVIEKIVDFPLAVTRMKALGFSDVWIHQQLKSEDLVEVLNTVSSVDESIYNSALRSFHQFSSLQPSFLGTTSPESHSSDGNTDLSPSDNLQSMIKYVIAGGFNPDQIQILTQASQLVQFFGFDLKRHSFDWYFDHGEFIHNSLLVCGEIESYYQEGFGKVRLDINQDLFLNLRYLDSTGKLPLLAQSIEIDGFELGESIIVALISANDEPLLSALEEYAQLSEKGNVEQIQLAQSMLLSELTLDSVSYMSDACEILNGLFDAAKTMEPYRLEELIYYVIVGGISLCLTSIADENYQKLVTRFFNDENNVVHKTQLRRVLIETILSAVAENDRAKTMFYVARLYENHGESYSFLLESPVINLLTQNQRALFTTCYYTNPAFKLAWKFSQILDNLDDYFDDSKLNANFINLLLKTYSLSSLTTFFSDEKIIKLLSAEVQKKYCSFFKLDPNLIGLYFSRTDYMAEGDPNLEDLTDENGAPTTVFFNQLLKNGSLERTYGIGEIRSLKESLKPHILEQLDPDSRQILSLFVRIQETTLLRNLLEQYQTILRNFNAYFVNGLPTSKLLTLLLSSKRQYIELVPADHNLLLELVDQFPSDLKNGWILMFHLCKLQKFQIDSLIQSEDKIIEAGIKYQEKQLNKLIAEHPILESLLLDLLISSETTLTNFIRLCEMLTQIDPDLMQSIILHKGKYLLTKAQDKIGLIVDTIESGKFDLLTKVLLNDSENDWDSLRLEIIREIIIPHCEKIDAFLEHTEKYKYEDIIHSVPRGVYFLINSITADANPNEEYSDVINEEVVSKLISDMSARNFPINHIIFVLEDRREKTGLDVRKMLIELGPQLAESYGGALSENMVELFNHFGQTAVQYELAVQGANDLSTLIISLFKYYQKTNPTNAELMRLLRIGANKVSISVTDLQIIEDYLEKVGSVNLLIQNEEKMIEMIRLLSNQLALVFITDILKLYYTDDGDSFDLERIESRRKSPYRFSARSFLTPVRQSFSPTLDGFNEELMDDFTHKSKQIAFRLFTSVLTSPDPEQLLEELSNFDLSFGIEENLYKSLLKDIRVAMNDLPATAEGFNMHNQRLSRSRRLPPFTAVLKPKLEELLLSQVSLPELDPAQLPHLLRSIISLYLDALTIYTEVSRKVVPQIIQYNKLIDRRLFGEGVWFSGRDGIPLYLACKASHWGKSLGNRAQYDAIIREQIRQNETQKSKIVALAVENRRSPILPNPEEVDSEEQLFEEGMEIYFATQARLVDLLKYISLSRITINNMSKEGRSATLQRELKRIGITPTMVGADTGGSGTVIRGAMEIALHKMDRTQMILWGAGQDYSKSYDLIEELPKHTDRTIILDSKGKPLALPTDADEALLAWVVDHVMMRSFITKTEDPPSLASVEKVEEQSE